MDAPRDTNPLLYPPEPLPIDAITFQDLVLNDLTLDSVDRVVQFSQQVVGEARQWQTYLNGLGLLTFGAWLRERSPDLRPNDADCSILQPATDFMNAVANLRVGEFKVCLLVAGEMGDHRVMLPRAVLDLPEYTAHLYVVIELWEAEELGQIRGFLTYTQLAALRQFGQLFAQADWTYELAFSHFDPEPDRLLLYLRCLDPTAILLPALTNCGAAITPLQPVLNVGSWLQNTLDDVAQTLYWMLLPPLAPAATGLRSPQTAALLPQEELQSILAMLPQADLALPEQVYSAYQDLRLESISLRLYVTVWAREPEEHSEWGLLIIVGAPGQGRLPSGLKLEIQDQANTLVERLVPAETEEAYLYACVFGTQTETFGITLSLPGGAAIHTPSLAFQPEI
jgi:hypothetical protein